MRAVWLAVAVSAGVHGALLAWPSDTPADKAPVTGRGAALAVRLLTAVPPAADRPSQRSEEANAAAGLADTAGRTPDRAGQAGVNPATQAPAYWPAALLERAPVPVSAPDTRRLQGEDLPAGSLRLELFIDSAGQVQAVRSADPEQAGADLPAPLAAMFLDTRFLPGIRAGHEVPSRIVIEVSIQDLLRIS